MSGGTGRGWWVPQEVGEMLGSRPLLSLVWPLRSEVAVSTLSPGPDVGVPPHNPHPILFRL